MPRTLKIPGLPVILTTNTKGGSGKTMTAEALAVAAMLAGYLVCVLDLDPIGSMYKWKSRRRFTQAIARGQERFGRVPTDSELAALLDEPDPLGEIIVTPAQAHAIGDSLKILKKGGRNFVIIDTAGSRQNYAEQAAQYADLVLIPTKTVTKEIEHLPDTLNQLALGGHPPRFCLFNRVNPLVTTGLEGPKQIVRDHYNTTPFPYHFTTRTIWDEADDMGLTPQELPRDPAAAEEIARAFAFICDFLNLPRSVKTNAADDEHARPDEVARNKDAATAASGSERARA
jgi:cellulose biosynthesis protein BcsQ